LLQIFVLVEKRATLIVVFGCISSRLGPETESLAKERTELSCVLVSCSLEATQISQSRRQSCPD